MLDPMIQALLQRLPQLTSYAIWEKSPAEAREDFRQFCSFGAPGNLPIGKVENISAGSIPLRSYTPVARDSELLPVIIYFHGGGFVLGDLDCYDALCRTLANESGCRVISVDYRLAPEHSFPAAVDDCFAVVQWVENHAPELLVDANRIAVAGDSAGGNLAAVVCQKAKEKQKLARDRISAADLSGLAIEQRSGTRRGSRFGRRNGVPAGYAGAELVLPLLCAGGDGPVGSALVSPECGRSHGVASRLHCDRRIGSVEGRCCRLLPSG